MLLKRVWANILPGAAVIERPDWIFENNNSSVENRDPGIYEVVFIDVVLKSLFCTMTAD